MVSLLILSRSRRWQSFRKTNYSWSIAPGRTASATRSSSAGGKPTEPMVTPVIVVLDEARDLGFEITGQIIVLEQNAVLERLVPALDLALDLRMAWGAA